ncbi:MAG: GNAT family N-acetyltransferase [Proteobacteria bacterium]|nr:GNAT family N-acetyltransferase [Pseudomonadota bacterium]
MHLQHAKSSDVATIVALLADDPLGSKRERFESPLPACYCDAFASINEDPNNELIVAKLDEKVLAVLQLTFIPSLTYQGRWRAQIEGVRVASEFRSKGISCDIFQWAINRARERDCHMIQLTTNSGALLRRRSDGFYPATTDG